MNLANKRILVVGASADLSARLNKMLYGSGGTVGLHYNRNEKALSKYKENKNVRKFRKDLNSSHSCYELVDDFVGWAGGIDCLIQMSGDIKGLSHWEKLKEEEWHHDLSANLVMPFFLAQRSIHHMKDGGGRIILMSTSSASHGGGASSLAYGTAKAGVECVVKRMAKDCAKYNILVNAVAPGFVSTKFHTERMGKTKKQLKERVGLVPLKRAGTIEEITGTVMFLLSKSASYITGQVIAVCGGDWL